MMRHPELAANLHMPGTPGVAGRRLLSTVNEDKLRRILTKMLDENEFFGPHGIRALSLYHRIIRLSSTWRGRSLRLDIFREIPTAGCSEGTRTGEARCGCR